MVTGTLVVGGSQAQDDKPGVWRGGWRDQQGLVVKGLRAR